MGQRVLILGESGTGKSASLRYFKPEEVLVINCAKKPLPFKNKFAIVEPSFQRLTHEILQAMQATQKKVIIIDDAQYIMSFQYMRRIKENGWDKWNDIQGDFFNIIMMVDELPKDTVVYFLSHIQRDEEGREKIKTMGKMLDEKITIEGLFTTVLKTSVQDNKYCFLTQNNGKDTVKSPIGMFDSYAIVNDLKYVDEKIRNYYEIGDFVPDEEMKKLDEEKVQPEVEKPDSDGRRRRRTSTSEEPKAEEPKTEETGSKEPEKAAEPEDKTTDGSNRIRRRKDRNGEKKEEKLTETPVEEKKEETAGSTERKRRRRRSAEDTDASTVPNNSDNQGDISDDDLPFI